MPADAGDRSDAKQAVTGTTNRNGGVRIACVATGVPGGRPQGEHSAGRAAGRRSKRLEVARPVEPGDRSDTCKPARTQHTRTVA
ncbi:hypothetical protein GCM10010402_71250 [Actinomadura luteofluorescens]